MALMNQYCGPKASPIEPLQHSFIVVDEAYACEWCEAVMGKDEAKEWADKYDMKVVARLTGRKEWSE